MSAHPASEAPTRARLEMAVSDPRGVRIAAGLGVDRVELCSGLELGGLSPSQGLVERALAAASGEDTAGGLGAGEPGAGGLGAETAGPAGSHPAVHVLVRSRAGGFEYSGDEILTMVAEIRAYRAQGVAGVVIGALSGGALDLIALERLAAAAEGLELTLHRAFDYTSDLGTALAQLAEFGARTGTPFRRVLTSGGRESVGEALVELRALAANPYGIEIMAGGGLTPENLPSVRDTGVQGLHFSARSAYPEAAGVSLGSAGGGDVRWATDPERAARFLAARDAT